MGEQHEVPDHLRVVMPQRICAVVAQVARLVHMEAMRQVGHVAHINDALEV